VPPPAPLSGTQDEFIEGLPIEGGFRVPCIIISPWTVGGWVATERFDHTSVLQFLAKVSSLVKRSATGAAANSPVHTVLTGGVAFGGILTRIPTSYLLIAHRLRQRWVRPGRIMISGATNPLYLI
jgi:phospholipase C